MIIYKSLFLDNFGEDDLIIMGLKSIDRVSDKNMYYNSMVIFNNKLNILATYNKINLVPFGEFIPFESILGIIGLKPVTNSYQSFSRGKK